MNDNPSYLHCIAQLDIIFAETATEEQTAEARSSLVIAAAPEYMEAMMDQIWETTDDECFETDGECDDPDCLCHELEDNPDFDCGGPVYRTIDDDKEEIPPCDSPSLN